MTFYYISFILSSDYQIAEILSMTEKYISSQGLLIQSVHLLLLIRLQAKKPILEILPIRTTKKIRGYVKNL